MDETGDFFSGALNTARDVLAELVTRAGLHLRPEIPGRPARDDVPAGHFIEQVIVLGGILADPAPHAKRMARALRRWRAAGEMTPVSLQAVPRFRAGRLAESFAQVLSVRLNDALAVAWSDTG